MKCIPSRAPCIMERLPEFIAGLGWIQGCRRELHPLSRSQRVPFRAVLIAHGGNEMLSSHTGRHSIARPHPNEISFFNNEIIKSYRRHRTFLQPNPAGFPCRTETALEMNAGHEHAWRSVHGIQSRRPGMGRIGPDPLYQTGGWRGYDFGRPGPGKPERQARLENLQRRGVTLIAAPTNLVAASDLNDDCRLKPVAADSSRRR